MKSLYVGLVSATLIVGSVAYIALADPGKLIDHIRQTLLGVGVVRRLAQISLEGSQGPPTQSQDIAEEVLANSMRPRFSIDDIE